MLRPLVNHPDTRDAVDRAREACNKHRWHPAMRRRSEHVAAEARVHAAHSSAALAGADLPIALVRHMTMGAAEPLDAASRVALAAARATAAAHHVGTQPGHIVQSAPRQALAGIHVAASSDHHPDTMGRPRAPGELVVDDTMDLPLPDAAHLEGRLAALWELPAVSMEVPALVVAALVSAEIACARAFPHSNSIVSRAAFRAIITSRGLDPLGVSVPEAIMRENPVEYAARLHAYTVGDVAGVIGWITYCGATIEKGCEYSATLASAVLAGSLP